MSVIIANFRLTYKLAKIIIIDHTVRECAKGVSVINAVYNIVHAICCILNAYHRIINIQYNKLVIECI